jgi:hypothetical protein
VSPGDRVRTLGGRVAHIVATHKGWYGFTGTWVTSTTAVCGRKLWSPVSAADDLRPCPACAARVMP